MTATPTPGSTDPTADERETLIVALARHRGFLLQTADGLTEEQARTASTVSALTVSSILKHVADTEEQWVRFTVEGPAALGGDFVEQDWTADETGGEWVDTRFVLTEDDTLPRLRRRVLEVAARTEEVLRTADLGATHPLPAAPWFEPGAQWSVRRVALHVLAETSQHAGHADIIREAIDGARTMG